MCKARDCKQICHNRGTHGVSLHYYSISAKSQSVRLVKQEAPTSLGGGGRHCYIVTSDMMLHVLCFLFFLFAVILSLLYSS